MFENTTNNNEKIPTNFKYISLGAIILLILLFLLFYFWPW